jgi:uncharacterized membrane protein
MSRWRLALLLLAGAAYAVLSHWMMLYHAGEPWAVIVLLVPLWLTALGLAAGRFGWKGLVPALIVGVAAFWLVLQGEVGDPNRLYVLQHAGINALLGGWFGASLRGNRLSLIGEFAQRVHALSPAQRIYTAQVTKVWTAYFLLMVLASIAIYLMLPFAAWSLFANVLTPLFVAALFLGEHLVRYRLHPEFERTRLVDAVRAFYAPAPDRGVER